jgi:hypothetical protein
MTYRRDSNTIRLILIDNLLPALNQVRIGNGRHKVVPILMVHIETSVLHYTAKITEKMPSKRLSRARDPTCSPDISLMASGHSEQSQE